MPVGFYAQYTFMRSVFTQPPLLDPFTWSSAKLLFQNWSMVTGGSAFFVLLSNADLVSLVRKLPPGGWLVLAGLMNGAWLWVWHRRFRAEGFFASLPYLYAPAMIPAMLFSITVGLLTLHGHDWNLATPYGLDFSRYTFLPLLLASIATLTVLREGMSIYPNRVQARRAGLVIALVTLALLPRYVARAVYFPRYFRPETSATQWRSVGSFYADKKACLQLDPGLAIVGKCFLFERAQLSGGERLKVADRPKRHRVRNIRIDTQSANRYRGPLFLTVKFDDGKVREFASYSRPGYRYQYFRLPLDAPPIAEIVAPRVPETPKVGVNLLAYY